MTNKSLIEKKSNDKKGVAILGVKLEKSLILSFKETCQERNLKQNHTIERLIKEFLKEC